jgi:hypothetical protein
MASTIEGSSSKTRASAIACLWTFYAAPNPTLLGEMLMTDHPITPPPELVEQWIEETRSYDCVGAYPADLEECVATRAAQWGYQQAIEELETFLRKGNDAN